MSSGDLSKPPPSASRPPHRGEKPQYTTAFELRERCSSPNCPCEVSQPPQNGAPLRARTDDPNAAVPFAMLCGVADAATLCREGTLPSSKIHSAIEKLAGLGLVQVQPTRPKMFAARPSEVVVARIIEIARERSERFASQASELHATFTGL